MFLAKSAKKIKEFSQYVAIRLRWIITFRCLPVESWLKGAALLQSSRFEDARKHFEAGFLKIKNHPAELSARFDLGLCYQRLGKPLLAEEQYQRILAKAPRLKEVHLALCDLYFELGEPLKLINVAKRAIRNGFSHEDFFHFVTIAIADDDEQISSAIIRRIPFQYLSEGIESESVQVALGALLIKSGKIREALLVLTPLVGNVTLGKYVLVKMVEVLLQLGKPKQAQAIALEGLKKHPHSPRILSLCAQCYLDSNSEEHIELAHFSAVEACRLTGWDSSRYVKVVSSTYAALGEVEIAQSLRESRVRRKPAKIILMDRDQTIVH